jgi:hypothetical protein
VTRLTRTIALSAWVGLATAACDRVEPYAMDQPIAMGRYTFAVVAATEGKTWISAEGPVHEIEVRLRIDRDDSAPFTSSFSESFIEHFQIVDEAGNNIGTTPVPISPTYKGGRYRASQYSCLFRFSRSSSGVRDFSAIGTRPAAFQLIVDNPAPEDGQPRRVAVPLH